MKKPISKLLAIAAILAAGSVALHVHAKDDVDLDDSDEYAESCTLTTPVENAPCLTAVLTQPDSLGKSGYTLTNECASRGDVVAKVNLREDEFPGTTADHTVRLTSSQKTVKKTTTGRFDGIYCCNDSSDLCEPVDICERDFANSVAGQTCTNSVIEADGDYCNIVSNCTTLQGGASVDEISVYWSDTKKLRNCDGALSFANC